MGQKMLIKEASEKTGISGWELRRGIKCGRYPALKVGAGKGKYILDIELLEKRINELMQMNVSTENEYNHGDRGQIRRIV
jgi:hypothetical protein